MAFDCPVCNKRVSDRVPLCPHCGCKIVRLDLKLSGSQFSGTPSDFTTMKVVQLLGAAMVVAGPVVWSLGSDLLTGTIVFTFGVALSLVAWLFSRHSQP